MIGFVEGGGGAEIPKYGYMRGNRPDCRQTNYSLCVTMNPTVPLLHQAFPGNTVDSKTMKKAMVRLRDGLEQGNLREVRPIQIHDRAILEIRDAVLEALEKEPDVNFPLNVIYGPSNRPFQTSL